MDERRKTVRVGCDIYCGYDNAPSRKMKEPEIASTAVTHDLSEGGARLLVFQFLPVGQKILVHLEIPRSEPLETVFEIMWVSEVPRSDKRFEVGGRFTTLAEDQRDLLRRYLYAASLLGLV